MNKKTTDIVAYITLIGWLVAFFAGTKEESKFHLNRSLVLIIANVIAGVVSSILSLIPVVGGIISSVIGILLFVVWILSLVSAIKGEEKPMPVVDDIKIIK